MTASLNSSLPVFERIDLRSLRFDPQNPRLPSAVDGTAFEQVLAFMLDDAGLVDLMRSMAAQGFFPGEPILVAEVPNEPGVYVVVEGNRRLAAALLLSDPDKAPLAKSAVKSVAALADPGEFESLPCLVFSTYSSILQHLGYRHVTGVKEWEPLAKARFLRNRFDADPDAGENAARFKQVARTIGSRADYVGRLLTALRLYELWEAQDYFGIGVNEDTVQFSLISSALSYQAIYETIGLRSAYDLDMPNLDLAKVRFVFGFMFAEDIDHRTRLLESRNLGRFAKVLANREAAQALFAGSSLADAEALSGDTTAVISGALRRAGSQLQIVLDRLKEGHVIAVDESEIELVYATILGIRDYVASHSREPRA